MNVYHLSKRLTKVVEYLPQGAKFADIGSDHAYLPCSVCLEDPYASAIAGEVNRGPYETALEEVAAHDLTERVSVRLGDGLGVLGHNEVQQVVIAGMGGPLIRDILEQGKAKLESVDRIITQPNIDARSIREWFYQEGFQLIDEEILSENGHIYEVLVAEPADFGKVGLTKYTEKEMWLGPFLLRKGGPVFQEKCKEELDKKTFILSQVQQAVSTNEEKVKNLQQEIQWLEEVIHT